MTAQGTLAEGNNVGGTGGDWKLRHWRSSGWLEGAGFVCDDVRTGHSPCDRRVGLFLRRDSTHVELHMRRYCLVSPPV
uniref:Uncharacterized protein n=1 Tax=Peronospora matthiolae TaxID=2874970 RepID=A0AAV1VMK2_9STRA